MKLIFLNILCLTAILSSGQIDTIYRVKQAWWQADIIKDSIPGISLEQAYDYLKGRKSKPVVVAIIDGSVDSTHEDLQKILWTNKNEIPSNGIDDDKNGYIDDTHGWCYVANEKKELQSFTLNDEARVVKLWAKKFEGINRIKLQGPTKVQYEIYQSAKKLLAEKYDSGLPELAKLARQLRNDINNFTGYLAHILPAYRDTFFTKVPFDSLPFTTPADSLKNRFWYLCQKVYLFPPVPSDPTVGFISGMIRAPARADRLLANIVAMWEALDTSKNFRSNVGDDPYNMHDVHYGTNAINISPSLHATHIAGIIAANRNNDLGIKGICENVSIIPLVANSPAGILTDKDVVLAARYAIDNGASIINMSFAGNFKEHVKEMREIFDYARKKNVLIVNAAGNNSMNLDTVKYWTGQSSNGKLLDNYIRVGATTEKLDENLVSFLSNYGANSIDLFAPGSNIVSTAPGNQYRSQTGSSLSAPMVVGVAAILMSYFPDLTVKEIKEVLVKSVYKTEIEVIVPKTKTKTPFSKLSKSGGILNAYNAVVYADQLHKQKTRRK